MSFERSACLTLITLGILCTVIENTGVSAAAGNGTPTQPQATVHVETSPLGATTIVDPYRWMEDPGSSEFASWTKAQDDFTRATLAGRTRNAELLRRITELAGTQDEVGSIRFLAEQLFYAKRPVSAATFRLFVRDREGKDRLLFDPTTIGPSSSIDFYEPSPNAKYVALGISESGSEDSRLRVLDVRTGRLLDESVGRATGGMPQWHPDSKSFFYLRHPPLEPGAPAAARSQKARSYVHVVGTDFSRDLAVFGYGVSPQVPVGLNDWTWVRTYGDSPYALAVARHGAQTDRTIYYAPLASVGEHTPWKKLTDVEDAVDDYLVHGRDVYLLTHKNAPRFKVVRTSLDAPDVAHAETVIPSGDAVAVAMMVGSDALYVRMLDAGLGRIVRVPFGGGPTTQLTLPFDGTVASLYAEPGTPGMAVQLESWTRPLASYRFDPVAGRFAELTLTAPVKQGAPLESQEVTVASADGTKIPLSIVYLRGLDLSRPHPTLLSAYGSYGVSMNSSYNPRRVAWFERGGIYAVAHVRGGGEFGEEWHVAGMKQNKQRSVDDLVACARYLISRKLATAGTLAVMGRSAGGITIGGAVTQHPELFRAAVIEVGIVDPLRFENTSLGATNAHEFGSWAKPEEREPLYAMSPYYHIVKGKRYPAVLLTGGAHDARVPLWQPAKMAARLQAATSSERPIFLRVDYEGGHGYSNEIGFNSDTADCYAFLLWQIGVTGFGHVGARP